MKGLNVAGKVKEEIIAANPMTYADDICGGGFWKADS
jgi:hypothetical protein